MKVTSILGSVALSMSKRDACGGELDQAKPEVPGISVGFVRLDVGNAANRILELLNEEVGLHWALTNGSLRPNPEPSTHGPESDLSASPRPLPELGRLRTTRRRGP